MKLLILCVFAIIAFSAGTPAFERGCIWINGQCSSECPVGTHGYGTGCSFLTPEATCENPEPKEDTRLKICDFSACYCDPPTVRETNTRECIPVDQCPKNNDKL